MTSARAAWAALLGVAAVSHGAVALAAASSPSAAAGGAFMPAVRPVLVSQADYGLGVIAPALPLPVRLRRDVQVTAELPPCEPAAPPGDDTASLAAAGEQPEGATGQVRAAAQQPASGANAGAGLQAWECQAIPLPNDDIALGNDATPALDYIPKPYGMGAPVNWGRLVGSPPKPWFSDVAPQQGVVLGSRSLTYRSLEGPSLSLGSLNPFTPGWASAASIGGVQLSNLTAPNSANVPEGKLGYSSVWGRINNTDTSATAGAIDYGRPAGTSSLRYGLTPNFTLEGQVQSAPALTATGLGTTYTAGNWGTVQAGATQGRLDSSEGWRYRLGYNVALFDMLTLGYANELTSVGYGDLSTYEGGAIDSRQVRSTLSAGVPIGSWGMLSGTYSGLRDEGGEILEHRYGLSQSVMLGPGVRFAVGADRDEVSGDYAVNMQLMLPIGAR